MNFRLAANDHENRLLCLLSRLSGCRFSFRYDGWVFKYYESICNPHNKLYAVFLMNSSQEGLHRTTKENACRTDMSPFAVSPYFRIRWLAIFHLCVLASAAVETTDAAGSLTTSVVTTDVTSTSSSTSNFIRLHFLSRQHRTAIRLRVFCACTNHQYFILTAHTISLYFPSDCWPRILDID